MLSIVAFIVCVVALLLNIIGVAIPYWEYVSRDDYIYGSIFYGLWVRCVYDEGLTQCRSYTSGKWRVNPKKNAHTCIHICHYNIASDEAFFMLSSKQLEGYFAFGLFVCPSVHSSVRQSCQQNISKSDRARALKLRVNKFEIII